MKQHYRIAAACLLSSAFLLPAHVTPAAATSHYMLWVADGRYGGWGWSKPTGIFGGPRFVFSEGAFGGPHGCEYWYPAYGWAGPLYPENARNC